jgi:hypothetical protein
MEKLRDRTPSSRGLGRQPATSWQRRFLQCLRVSPDVSAACAQVGISRQTAYRWREQDETFRAEWADAISESVEKLEALAFKKAAEGEISLITWLLRCHKPSVYGDKTRHEVGIAAKIVLIPAKAEGDE